MRAAFKKAALKSTPKVCACALHKTGKTIFFHKSLNTYRKLLLEQNKTLLQKINYLCCIGNSIEHWLMYNK